MNIIRELVKRLAKEAFAAKEMPAGTAWKVGNRGWAAKNSAGKTDYWYGQDEAKNKAAAERFAKGQVTAQQTLSKVAKLREFISRRIQERSNQKR